LTVSLIGALNAYSTIFGIKSGAEIAVRLFPGSVFMLFYCTILSGVGGLLLRLLVLSLLNLPLNLSQFRVPLIRVLIISFVWCYAARCSIPFLTRATIEWILFLSFVLYDLFATSLLTNLISKHQTTAQKMEKKRE
jgi:hypothetical protein